MTKAELIADLAKKLDISQTKADSFLKALMETTVRMLRKESRFVLPGLGIFEMVEHQTRQARNPRTNEAITVEAHKSVKFKATKALKELIN